jgi:hypothetical protein
MLRVLSPSFEEEITLETFIPRSEIHALRQTILTSGDDDDDICVFENNLLNFCKDKLKKNTADISVV